MERRSVEYDDLGSTSDRDSPEVARSASRVRAGLGGARSVCARRVVSAGLVVAVTVVACVSAAGAASTPRFSTAGIPVATQRAFRIFSSHPGAHVTSGKRSSLTRILSGALRHPLGKGTPPGKGAHLATARLVTVSSTVKVLVLAGPHGICVATEVPAGSRPPLSSQTITVADCGATTDAEQSGIGGTSGGQIAYGIVPNGNQTVTITTGGKRRVTVPVVANVYYATGLHGDNHITFLHH
jgi:hypothetical protein